MSINLKKTMLFVAAFLTVIVVFSACSRNPKGTASESSTTLDSQSKSSVENKINVLKDVESTVSPVNWTDKKEVYFAALNREKMALSSAFHLPIYKCDTLGDLSRFKSSFNDAFGLNEFSQFNSTTEKYDDTFFKSNSLLIIYISADSSSYRFDVESVVCNNKSLCVHIAETTKSEVGDTAMAGWLVTVAVPDETAKACTEFDADLISQN